MFICSVQQRPNFPQMDTQLFTTSYKRVHPFPTDLKGHLCETEFPSVWVYGFILDSLFCSTGLFASPKQHHRDDCSSFAVNLGI